jgi:hypothetical protein
MNKLAPDITGLFCLCLIVTIATMPALELRETFLEGSEGALLTTLPNWTFSGPQDTWSITSAGPGEGGAVEAASPGTYQRALNPEESVDPSTGPTIFKVKIRFAGPDSWADFRISLLQSGGVNGIGICFQGGGGEGSADNVIGISESGSSWGDIKFEILETQWQSDVWYQVEIDSLQWSGGALSGVVSVYEAGNPAQKLIDRKPLGVFGQASGFQKIDLISFGSVGAARAFQIADIEFGPDKTAAR